MKENRKIKNATECEYNGIHFRSKLERSAYKMFEALHIDVNYEPEPVVLLSGWRPTIRHIIHGKDNTTKTGYKKILDWTYTPDFIFDRNGKRYFIEMKGRGNDNLPLKRKMFLRYLEDNYNCDEVEYWEVYGIGELAKLLNHIL